MNDRDMVKLAIVEFLGPFVLVFAGVGAIIQTQGGDVVAIALAHGLAIGLMVSAVGHISGGAFNPAITLGLWVTGRIESSRAALYVVAQLLGGLAGAAVLTLVYRDVERNAAGVNLGVPTVASGYSVGNALVMEAILTFFLMFVIYGVAIDHRTGRVMSGLAIGLTITLDILAGGVVSGAAMNPARALGPALVQGDFEHHWIWWVGPAIGAALAAVLYHGVLLAGVVAAEAPSDNVDPEHPRSAPGSDDAIAGPGGRPAASGGRPAGTSGSSRGGRRSGRRRR